MEESDPDPDQYQAELSEKTDDGGGCVEMWSALSGMREEESNESGVARRTFLKVGSASAFAAFFPGVSSAAEEPDSETEIEIEWLEGPEANKVAAKARGTDEYRQLLQKTRRLGSKVRPAPENTMVARVTDGNNVRELVAFEVESSKADTSHLTIGMNSQRDTVPVAALEFADRKEDNTRKKVTVYDASGRGIERKVVDVEEKLNRAQEAETNGGEFTTQSQTTCTGCKAAVGLICQIGCSAPLAFICGLLGITVIGGIGCLTFVAIVCGLISIFGCSTPADEICRDPQLGLCP
jgi:halocin C8-like bacteriocin domain-containing protein